LGLGFGVQGSGFRTGFRVPGFGFRGLGFGFWVSGFGVRAPRRKAGSAPRPRRGAALLPGVGLSSLFGFGFLLSSSAILFYVFCFLVCSFGVRVYSVGVRALQLRQFRVSGLRFRAYGFRHRSVFGSGFGSWFRISGLAASLKSGFRVAGSGSRFGASASLTSDSGFQVPGVRFRVSGVGKRRTRREGEPPRSGWESGCQVSG
jgi:hypothetical protein